jgi:hypothetical protein
VEVVHVDAIADDIVSELIRLAEDDARLDPAARHPRGEATRMMIAAEVRLDFALAIIRSPKFAAPHYSVSSSIPRAFKSLSSAAAGDLFLCRSPAIHRAGHCDDPSPGDRAE